MTTLPSFGRTAKTVVISLVTDHRAQATVALALALVAGALLGTESADDRWGVTGGFR